MRNFIWLIGRGPTLVFWDAGKSRGSSMQAMLHFIVVGGNHRVSPLTLPLGYILFVLQTGIFTSGAYYRGNMSE